MVEEDEYWGKDISNDGVGLDYGQGFIANFYQNNQKNLNSVVPPAQESKLIQY